MINHSDHTKMYGTTIISVRDDNEVVVAGDGQVTLGHTVMKSTTNKIRRLYNGKVIAGIAGSTADALALIERLDTKLEKYSGQLDRACVEMAKDWRTDRYLRKLEAMMIVADKHKTYMVSGTGDVLEPEKRIAAIGSGGSYALSAARAVMYSSDYLNNSKLYNANDTKKKKNFSHKTMTPEDVAIISLEIASEICIYSNNNIILEKIKC